MREFTADYLEHTRRGMWESTAALSPLSLADRERVLDVGCGTGELALYLARMGHDVLGIDIAPRAIDQAKAKARWRRIQGAHFLVWDALDIPRLAERGFRFRTVTDSAMFHVLAERDRDGFIDGLETVLGPGGRYFVLGDERRDEDDVYGITPDELRTRFRTEDGWTVEFVYATAFERRLGNTPAYIADIRRNGPRPASGQGSSTHRNATITVQPVHEEAWTTDAPLRRG